jgi:hypothetical protein
MFTAKLEVKHRKNVPLIGKPLKLVGSRAGQGISESWAGSMTLKAGNFWRRATRC